MTGAVQWNTLASALRELHRALMDRARVDYEHEHLVAVDPGELLRLLTTDPYFEWLRALSELMVDIDLIRDAEAAARDELSTAVRAAVEHLIAAPAGSASPFAERYLPYLQDDPHVAMAHGALRQALLAWPPPQKEDAASLLHERHRLAEKARHRAPRR